MSFLQEVGNTDAILGFWNWITGLNAALLIGHALLISYRQRTKNCLVAELDGKPKRALTPSLAVSVSDLVTTNEMLRSQIDTLKAAEELLRQTNYELQQRIADSSATAEAQSRELAE